MFRASALLVAAALLLVGCTQKMAQAPRYDPYSPSDFFSDGSSARPLPADTVAQGHLRDDTALFTGKDANGQDVTELPFPATREVLQRGFTPPPSFHSDELRNAPVGHFFDVMSNGLGPMPSYASQIAVPDRWAIVAYIRALQLSQHATLDEVPPDQRAALEQQP